MFNPSAYKTPKPSKSKSKIILEKHGYEFSGDDIDHITIIPKREKFYELMNFSEDVTDAEKFTLYAYCRKDYAIRSKAGESMKDFMLRLGWIREDPVTGEAIIV